MSRPILDCPELAALSPSELQARIDRLSPGQLKEFDVLVESFERDALLAQYQVDPLRFGRATFPHHFRLPTAARWHGDAIALLTQTARVEEFPKMGKTLTSLEPLCPPPPPIFPPGNSPNSVISTRSQAVASAPGQAMRSPLRLAMAAPRGHAKSTLASFLLPLWHLALDTKHFILLVSNTHAQAVKFLQAIKYEWETNRCAQRQCGREGRPFCLAHLVPGVRPNKEKWSDSDIELFRNGKLAHKVVALGSGHQLRGLKFLQYRPDLIILDDTEDDEMVRSDLRRLSYQEWVDNVVLKVDPQCDIVKVGTIIHEQALLNRLVRQTDDVDKHRYGDWTRRLFTALDASHQSTWPERESTQELLTQQAQNPYSFSQEKQGQPVDPSYCPFKTAFFTERRWWTQLPRDLSISITIDPAWTIRDHSKETALICAGWDAQARLWVLDEHHAKYDDPSLILDLILDWYLRWNKNEQVNPGQKFFCVGFDAVSAQKMLLTSFRDRCRERNLHPHLRELKADRDKIRRIWQLEPLFRHERIFLRPDMTYLQHQLQGFPRNVQGGLVDVADALAYFCQLEPYRPEATAEEAPVSTKPFQMSFDEYANLHEDVRAYRQRFPESEGTMDDVLTGILARRN